PAAQTVNLSVYTVTGSRVATLAAETMSAGQHEVTWYGRDDLGRQVGSGMYLYRLETVNFCQTRQMVLLK
ncbi:MAG: FlgD immunoglobulin-like domain containing protein, partial [bacterium]